MIKQVHEGISVGIRGKVFKLVYDADHNELSACQRCALMGDVCKGSKYMSLIGLCASIVEEPQAFFVEATDYVWVNDNKVPADIVVHGINNQEIVISALRALRDAYKDMGNNARAEVAQKLIDQIK